MAAETSTCSPSLQPTHRLKELFPSFRFPKEFNEHELSPLPNTLKEVAETLQDEDYRKKEKRVVWISSKTFLTSDYRIQLPRRNWSQAHLELVLYPVPRACPAPMPTWTRRNGTWINDSDLYPHQTIRLYSEQISDSLSSLDMILSLQDVGYKIAYVTGFSFQQRLLERNLPYPELPICPLEHAHMEKMFQPTRKVGGMQNMRLTASQCQSLASFVGPEDNFEFKNCFFCDGGEALLDRLPQLERDSSRSCLSILHFSERLPVNQDIFAQLLKLDSTKKVVLGDIVLGRDASRSLATSMANLSDLLLMDCSFEDGGEALVESLKRGQGPQELSIAYHMTNEVGAPFGLKENWLRFFEAIETTNVKKLSLNLEKVRRDWTPDLMQALAKAVRRNQGLEDLSVHRFPTSQGAWESVFQAVANHPVLRKLCFTMYGLAAHGRRRRWTRALKDALTVNRQLEHVSFNGKDETMWKEEIVPRLQYNLYTKRLAPLPTLHSNRAATVGAALGHCREYPSLVWMILTQNKDVIADRLAGSRKRKLEQLQKENQP